MQTEHFRAKACAAPDAGGCRLRKKTRQSKKLDWRAIAGPALATATALIAILVDRIFTFVPNPAPLFVCIVVFAAALSGLASGLVSAAIAVAAPRCFFSTTAPRRATTPRTWSVC